MASISGSNSAPVVFRHLLSPRALDASTPEMKSNKHRETSAQRIALVGFGRFSYINPNLADALRRVFPGYHLDWIDVRLLMMWQGLPLTQLISTVHGMREFAGEAGFRLRQLMWRSHWTTYLFRERSFSASQKIARRTYICSIQTQALCDASLPDLPHFVYTDTTMLAHLQYETTRRQDLPVTDKWLALERRLYQNAQTCFVMSQNIGRSLVEDYGCAREKVVCAYAGCNASIEPINTKTYDQKTILFVGVDWERKGGPELLAAFRLLRKQMLDARLIVVGCTPNLDEPGCQIVGRVRPVDVGRYYASASLFCMPSRCEPFGIVFVEAMAHRLPIVSTRIGALPDMVTDGTNGFLVTPGDIEELAGALKRLLNNPALCRAMGERSYAVSRSYTWDNVASIMRNSIQRFVPELV